MEFLPEEIENYAIEHTSKEKGILSELNRQTHINILQPRMLSGHLQGRILSTFSHMIRPNRILEIGTYTGYSALCMAESLEDNGKLFTIDVNEELEPFTRSYFEKSDDGTKIEFIIGNALKIIPELNETWDLVVANILAVILIDLIRNEGLLQTVNLGGRIIFSGIINQQEEEFLNSMKYCTYFTSKIMFSFFTKVDSYSYHMKIL